MSDGAVDGVEIEWVEDRAANLANWEDRVPLHFQAYGTDALVTDPGHLSTVSRTYEWPGSGSSLVPCTFTIVARRD